MARIMNNKYPKDRLWNPSSVRERTTPLPGTNHS